MTPSASHWSRRGRLALLGLAAALLAGCSGAPGRPDRIWGERGVQGGDVVKPRAIAIDPQDRLYIVDWTARIQAFDRDGKYPRHRPGPPPIIATAGPAA